MTQRAAPQGRRADPLSSYSDQASNDPPIRLLLVDDSSVARAVMTRMIAGQEGLEVAATASNASSRNGFTARPYPRPTASSCGVRTASGGTVTTADRLPMSRA